MRSIRVTDRELEQETALLARQDPARFKKLKDKEEFRNQLREEKGAQILNRWYQQLGSNVKVKVYLDQIERRRAG